MKRHHQMFADRFVLGNELMRLKSTTSALSLVQQYLATQWSLAGSQTRKLQQNNLGAVAGLESLEERVLLAGTASGVGKRQTHIVLPKAKNDNAQLRSTKNLIRGNILRNDNLGNPKATLNYVISRGKKFKIRGTRVIQGKYGILRIQRTGKFTYRLRRNLAAIKRLDKGERKFDNFRYQIKGACGTSHARLRIKILGVEQNKPPKAVDDAYVFEYGEGVVIPPLLVLSNDSDPDNDPLSIVAIDLTGTAGSAIANPNGTISYTPPAVITFPVFVDTFTYTITDGNGGFSTATVTITIFSAQ